MIINWGNIPSPAEKPYFIKPEMMPSEPAKRPLGGKVKFVCKADGDPTPTIAWYKVIDFNSHPANKKDHLRDFIQVRLQLSEVPFNE